MIRTQVFLTEQQYRLIYQMAETEKKPAAQMVRELLDSGLQQKKHVSGKDALLQLVKIGKNARASGPKDLSKNLDRYLYE